MPSGTITEKVERLRAIPLFSALGQRSLQKIARMMQEFDAPAGRVLVQPNLPGSGLLVVEKGTVEVRSPRIHVERGPGAFIGELALLTDRGHTARVRAKTDVSGFAIGREDFRKMLLEEPKVTMALLEGVAARLADTLR